MDLKGRIEEKLWDKITDESRLDILALLEELDCRKINPVDKYEIETQLAYEKQIFRDMKDSTIVDKPRDPAIWTHDYHEGYINGLEQFLTFFE